MPKRQEGRDVTEPFAERGDVGTWSLPRRPGFAQQADGALRRRVRPREAALVWVNPSFKRYGVLDEDLGLISALTDVVLGRRTTVPAVRG